MKLPVKLVAGAIVAVLAGSVQAAATPEEIKQLGTTLLPWGAIKAGNAAGTIPAYEGQVKVPASYDPKKPGVRPNPYADEKPLFTITAANMDKYAQNLSEGVMEMLKKYPTFRLDVFPSHRNMAYPKWVQENSIKNASSCKSEDNNMTLVNCYAGVPFPIPKSGYEVMWNHLVKYTSEGEIEGSWSSYTVSSSGTAVLQGRQVSVMGNPWWLKDRKEPHAVGTDYYWYRHNSNAPARRANEGYLARSSTKMGPGTDRTWQYLPGQRRVKLSPDLSYDTPQPQSGGAQTMDDVRGFMGAMDRFEFKLIGRREMYIPYNNYDMNEGGKCTSNQQVHTPNFLNPDCVRWELHRVWEVEGKPKAGVRHLYSKRKVYFDEDQPSMGVATSYDQAGKPYRVHMVFGIPFYEAEAQFSDQSVTYDLQTGMYSTIVMSIGDGGTYLIPHKPSSFWTPDGLQASGVR